MHTRAYSMTHPWEATAALPCPPFRLPPRQPELSSNADPVGPAAAHAVARRNRTAPVIKMEGALHGPCRLSALDLVTKPTTTADRRTSPCHAYGPRIGTTTTTTTTTMTTKRTARQAIRATREAEELDDEAGGARTSRWRPPRINRTSTVATTARNRSNAAAVGRSSDRRYPAGATATTARSASIRATSMARAPAIGRAAAGR